MSLWFRAGHLKLSNGERVPVTVVGRDADLGLVLYERLPVNISVGAGLTGQRSRYCAGRLGDFEPAQPG